MAEIRYEVRARFGDDVEVTKAWAVREGDEDHQYVSSFLDGTVSIWDVAQIVTEGTGLDYRDASEVEVIRVYGPTR